jgi:hypothetical protein
MSKATSGEYRNDFGKAKARSPLGIPRGMCASLSSPGLCPKLIFSVPVKGARFAPNAHPFDARRYAAALRCGFRFALDC